MGGPEMSTEDSLFSCIKPKEKSEPHAMPPSPRPAPARPAEDPAAGLKARISELVERLKKLEERNAELPSNDRVSVLERTISALSEKVGPGLPAGNRDAGILEKQLGALKEENSALASRIAALEAATAKKTEVRGAGTDLELTALVERVKSIEKNLADELSRRFSGFDEAFSEVLRKALTAQETARGTMVRLEALEELSARLVYLENRLENAERRTGKFCESEAIAEALKVENERLEASLNELSKKSAVGAAERQRLASDLETLTAQFNQLSALFNHFRTELGFLVPKKKESAAG